MFKVKYCILSGKAKCRNKVKLEKNTTPLHRIREEHKMTSCALVCGNSNSHSSPGVKGCIEGGEGEG